MNPFRYFFYSTAIIFTAQLWKRIALTVMPGIGEHCGVGIVEESVQRSVKSRSTGTFIHVGHREVVRIDTAATAVPIMFQRIAMGQWCWWVRMGCSAPPSTSPREAIYCPSCPVWKTDFFLMGSWIPLCGRNAVKVNFESGLKVEG